MNRDVDDPGALALAGVGVGEALVAAAGAGTDAAGADGDLIDDMDVAKVGGGVGFATVG